MDSTDINYKVLKMSIRLSSSRVVLIGFMGSGKSSIGRKIAKESKFYFLDTDAMIESSEGKDIATIFKEKGEHYFRSLETQTVAWIKENVKEAVISAGGGMLASCDELKDLGRIIYLKVPFDVILKRMSPEELRKRPLFKNPEEALKLYNERNAIYEAKADVIIDANQSLEEVFKSYKKTL